MEATSQSQPIKMSEKSENSRTRLLDAAEVLFAEKGFEKTTVRDITTAAHCNVASINYHFKHKDNLYKEVYVRRVRQLRQVRFSAIDGVMSRGREATLEELIGTYARSFLEPLVDSQSGQAVMMLMTREMNEPRLPKEIFFEEMVWPVQERLEAAIAGLCPEVDAGSVVASIQAIVGQLLHYVRMRELHQANPQLPAPPETGAMIEHLVRFSAAGIRAFAGKGPGV
jgi:AcrR family transcriptional regulator